jgi:hypothetical protein
MSHLNSTSELAAGAKALPDGLKAFAHTQAMWRFLANERVTFRALSAPLLAAAHEAVAQVAGEWVLCVHDWSRLNYARHSSKRDRLRMTHALDVGYELQSSLLVSPVDGAPLAVAAQNLVAAHGCLQSWQEAVTPRKSHLDELSERMCWLEAQRFGRRLVHVIDREGDSVAHQREWTRRGQHWLVRVKGQCTVRYGDRSMRIEALARELVGREERQVQCKGQTMTQRIAGTWVVVTRPAKPKKSAADGRRVAPVAGEPLQARLVVSRLYDRQGRQCAVWYLLTSLPESVSDAQVALWYYFRWQIESFFKLLKHAGHHLEQWEQESASAIFKRLLIASHACVLVWRLAREASDSAEEARRFLVRLSGRQMKAHRPITMSALLDGTFKLLAMLEALERYSIEELRAFAHAILRRTHAQPGRGCHVV